MPVRTVLSAGSSLARLALPSRSLALQAQRRFIAGPSVGGPVHIPPVMWGLQPGERGDNVTYWCLYQKLKKLETDMAEIKARCKCTRAEPKRLNRKPTEYELSMILAGSPF
ncbi:hypothetical protein Dda_7388 [Drechslerella dactyloides]|uniref:Uncharacterized protein n=1 Tax=Drechslerella dactyloides TaxID=74499 RepID=A0AAD6NGR3_DREDA|nr:hypothetical protein Dda_7388 [Drechslerella dactyloides]